jgi:hypothetical protein
MGHALLNSLPSTTVFIRRGVAADAMPRQAQLKFRIAYSSFRVLAAAVAIFAAVQRGWRDFRMAQ